MRHCKNPCPECPYRKDSEPGYFGGNDPREYAEALHRDTIVACHTKSTYDNHEMVKEPVICAGHLIAQKNVCKQNRDPYAVTVLNTPEFQDTIKEQREDVLGFDFYTHHGVDHA